jgi:hypothetical protein
MSHFTVLVVGDEPETQLERFRDAEYDWYLLGGRWTGYFKLKPNKKGVSGEPGLMTEKAKRGYADSALNKDIESKGSGGPTFAVVKDGKWYARGEMGWWAQVSNVNDKWDKEFVKLLKSVSGDTLLSVYDCHI